jgi:hypothetical protein
MNCSLTEVKTVPQNDRKYIGFECHRNEVMFEMNATFL